MEASPLQILSTACFALAIVHVFFSDKLQLKAAGHEGSKHTIYAFFGNTALIFGFWLIPIVIAMLAIEGPQYTFNIFESIHYREPFAYFVLIAIATVRPMIQLFHFMMAKVSRFLGGRLSMWWATTLLLSALLSGCFSGIALIALLSLYLSSTFFLLKPSRSLIYYTFAMVLIVMSVGTTIIPLNFNFFFQTVKVDLSHWTVFHLFGWKTLVAVIALLALGQVFFRKEWKMLDKKRSRIFSPKESVSLRHFFYLLLLLIASFGSANAYILLMAIAVTIIVHKGFYREKGKEGELRLYLPLTIAFFTATLEFHARMQTWWAAPLLSSFGQGGTFVLGYLLTGLNIHVPLEAMKQSGNIQYLAVIAGGGLTIIARSGNIVAKKVLKHRFPGGVISPFRHLLYAIPLTLIYAGIVTLLEILL